MPVRGQLMATLNLDHNGANISNLTSRSLGMQGDILEFHLTITSVYLHQSFYSMGYRTNLVVITCSHRITRSFNLRRGRHGRVRLNSNHYFPPGQKTLAESADLIDTGREVSGTIFWGRIKPRELGRADSRMSCYIGE